MFAIVDFQITETIAISWLDPLAADLLERAGVLLQHGYCICDGARLFDRQDNPPEF
jgi:hypothetical protein